MPKSAFEKMAKKPAANDFSIYCTFGPVAENGTGKNEKIGLTGFIKNFLYKCKGNDLRPVHE